MIKVSINQDNNLINEITISGHSGYEELGKDIICSSISSISITTVNAILRIDDKAIKYDESDGYLKITILKHDKYVDLLIINMLDLFTELEKKYKKYIKILSKGGVSWI